MIQMSLAEAASILGLPSHSTTVEFTGFSIDTRTLIPGNLFIALPGSKVNGHDFLDRAQKQGAAAALVSRHVDTSTLPQLVVTDIVAAMGKLGAAWRDRFSIPFIAVTGSNGKTTLKNMIATILIAACDGNESEVLATQGTLNNHLGLPLTLARLHKQHRYAVIEMGMNHFGEIDYLTHLTKPDIAVITNAAAAHLEGVGDLAGVARAKAEIFLGLPQQGVAILNRDDAFYDYWRNQIGSHRFMTFGFNQDADVTVLKHHSGTKQDLIINTPQGELHIHLPLLGKHNVLNTLAATAVALAAHIPLKAIKTGLEAVNPAPGRLQMHTLNNGVMVIDDTYNANPFSLQAAVDTLAHFEGKKVLVLGDMKELGEDAAALHHSAGEHIRAAGIDYLFTFGELSANTTNAFGQGAKHFTEQEQLINAIKPLLNNTTTILVKGSRSMRMEKVVAGLLQ